MNRVIVVLILGFFHLTGYSQNHFIVKVNTTKLFGKMIYLNIFNNNDFIPVHRDSCKITDGDIRLVGYLDQPSQFARFFIKDKGKYISADFVIDSGENNINLELIEGTSKSLKIAF